METFFTADLHFNHLLMLRYREFLDLEEMDSRLIDNYNSVVGRRDRVYILGDFAWKNPKSYLARLNGRKILIVGNHDNYSGDVLSQFSGVYELKYMKFDGRRLFLAHRPHLTWDGSNSGSWHFHGHSHGRIAESPEVLRSDVGVDVWDYFPVSWGVLKKKMDSKVESFMVRERRTSQELQRIVEENLRLNRLFVDF